MEADIAGQGAVVFQLRIAVARGFIHLVVKFHLRDPPLADHRVLQRRHDGTPSSFGNRIRLAAVAVRVTIHPTRPSPR